MKRVIRHRITLLALLLALAPLATWSCEQEPEVIEITVQSDFSQLVAALENADASLSERMALLESAMKSGLADSQAAVALVRQAVQALRGSLEDKLAAVSEAVKSQGTSLETKLALIEAAIRTGFADAQAQRTLLQEAIASLGGNFEEKVAALEKAVKSQSTSLETKLGLVEAAFKDGLADNEAAQSLLKESIESLGGTLEEKMAAIGTALADQQVAISAKLPLIETALAEGFAAGKTRQDLLLQALSSLEGSEAEKLAAMESALVSGMSGLTTKIALIETALTNGFSSGATALQQIQTAMSALKGTINGEDGKIDSIIKTLGQMDSSTGSVCAALSQILVSLDTLSDYYARMESIFQSLELLMGRINGRAFVEMGDGLKWGICNVGAIDPWETGLYFAWGETVNKMDYSWDTYEWMQEGQNSEGYMTKYTYPDKQNKVRQVLWYDGDVFVGDNKKSFADYDYEDDMARQAWGATWRIPTFKELEWLMDDNHCEWVWTTDYEGTGVSGMVVKSKIPGYETNSIFLPVGGLQKGRAQEQTSIGYYWSSTLEEASYQGGVIDFGLRGVPQTVFKRSGCNDRYIGSLYRPVSD